MSQATTSQATTSQGTASRKKSLRSKSSPSTKRIAWSQIKDFFEGQWVELIDYKWDWNQAAPTWATVRHHASERSELLTAIRRSGAIEGSVVLYIGKIRSTFEHSLSAAV